MPLPLSAYTGEYTFELTWNGVRPGAERVRFAVGADGQPIELVLDGQTFVATGQKNETGLSRL